MYSIHPHTLTPTNTHKTNLNQIKAYQAAESAVLAADPIGLRAADAVLRATPLHHTHYAVYGAVEVGFWYICLYVCVCTHNPYPSTTKKTTTHTASTNNTNKLKNHRPPPVPSPPNPPPSPPPPP